MERNWKSASLGNVCCVPGCTHNEKENRELKFYSFPNRDYETERKKLWIARVHRDK